MSNYIDFYNKLFEYRMISSVYKHLLGLIEEEIKDVTNKEEVLILFSIYFSLINDGNICMSLDKDTL